MESLSGQSGEANIAGLDDVAFIDLLRTRDIRLHASDGQLRVNASSGALNDELREELKRRKAQLLSLVGNGRNPLGDFRRQDLGVRARRRVSAAGQWTPQLRYWKNQLEGTSGIVELPFSKRRLAEDAASVQVADVVHFGLERRYVLALREIGQQYGASFETVLLAGFSLLLSRYTGKTDFCIGLPVLLKQRRGDGLLEERLENVIAIRCRNLESGTFSDLLVAVDQMVDEGYAHSEIPFSRLLDILPIEIEPGVHPLFQNLFGVELSGCYRTALIDNKAESFPYNLALFLDNESEQGLEGHFRYNGGLFSRESIAIFAESYCALLQSVSTEPKQRLSEFSLLSPARTQQMLVDWNSTEIEIARDITIHTLFESMAAQSPNAVAVIDHGHSVTYEELNAKANRLAHFLLAKGIQRGAIVGICMSRSVEMVVSMLAVLKAGMAYLPLDPQYPAQRLESMLSDSRAALILADRELREAMSINGREITRIDLDSRDIAAMPASNLGIDVKPNDLAYVIYTSGSTGIPKGVAIEHHSTVSLLTWASLVYEKRELARVFAATSVCFDLSIFEIFLPLSVGGALVLANDFLELARAGAESQPTLLNTVPSAMAGFLESAAIPESVQCINLAGEPLSDVLVRAMQQQAPQARIVDLYGPTETTTYSTYALRRAGESPTIGVPLGNTKIYILDAHRKPVPPEVPGQIYIGGEGVARGYLHRPEFTRERFVSIEALPHKGRLYATGDLGRFRPDGNIEYLGRMDNQVKIRGFRVELGEIEATLQLHPRIREAVVVMRRGEGIGDTLVAFLVIASGPVNNDDLVAFQQKFLPHYMVVRSLVALDMLPVTLNGKIDRKALASMSLPAMLESTPVIAPINDTEQHLLEIWEKNFKRTHIGIDDDFFALGGHSLLAFHIFSDIEKQMNVSLQLSVLFKAPTIRLLADEIELKRQLVMR